MHTVLDGIITTIMATIQRINIIGSREGSRNRRRLKANQTGKKFRVGIKSNISTNRNNLISCLIWLDLVASLPLIKERILVIILLLHFLSLMLGSVLVLMLPLLVWLTPDLRIKKSLLKCNWTIRKRLPRCKMRLKKRLLAFSRRLHARIRKTRYMHKMRCLL